MTCFKISRWVLIVRFLTGEQENIDKFSKRLVKVTKQHNEECKKLLSLMGVPFIEVLPQSLTENCVELSFIMDITKLYTLHVKAPCEAEASCAALVKSGKVYATATEDMDGLTFGTTVLMRHLTASEAKYVWIRLISEIICL